MLLNALTALFNSLGPDFCFSAPFCLMANNLFFLRLNFGDVRLMPLSFHRPCPTDNDIASFRALPCKLLPFQRELLTLLRNSPVLLVNFKSTVFRFRFSDEIRFVDASSIA
mmetsp:Transcript_418/g.1592  ORF Transcript_418/g.1592 Transcript_418/m.1592 type:complete len:111 (-) Transcript_418:680-1012(-)